MSSNAEKLEEVLRLLFSVSGRLLLPRGISRRVLQGYAARLRRAADILEDI